MVRDAGNGPDAAHQGSANHDELMAAIAGGDADSLDAAVSAFVRATRLLDRVRLHVWDERGITLPQLRILFQVRETPGIGGRELARALDVSASNITQQVDKLEARGLLARAGRPEDRRQVSHTLTAEGVAVAGEISSAARAELSSLLGQLTPGERADLTRVLNRVVAIANNVASA